MAGFEKGFIEYKVSREPAIDQDLTCQDWDDGYLAFSKGEKRLENIDLAKLNDFQNQKVQGIGSVEGYLMEIDLWRSRNGIYEEIAIERDDTGFYCQKWELDTENKEFNCYYRRVKTLVRKAIGNAKEIFKNDELQSIEVVYPEKRLHFFITAGGK